MPRAGQVRVLRSYPSAAVFAVAMHSVWLGLFFWISAVGRAFLSSLPMLVGYRCEPWCPIGRMADWSLSNPAGWKWDV